MSRSIPLLREAAWTMVVSASVLAVCGILLWIDPGYFWLDDYQNSLLAGSREIARAWSAGELPLLSQFSWYAGAAAGEHLHSTFSVASTLCSIWAWSLDLSLPATAATISFVFLSILAAGSFRLARLRNLPVSLAWAVAGVAALNGWMIGWAANCWLPALSSFAWLPWFWWASERAMRAERSRTRLILPSLFLYSIISAGWPFTDLMALLVSSWLCYRSWTERRQLQRLWPVALTWCLGSALAAPSLLLLFEYGAATVRSSTPFWTLNFWWTVPIWALPGLILPTIASDWCVWGDWRPHRSLELAGGFVPLVGLVGGLALGWRKTWRTNRWDLLLLAGVLLLAMWPSVGVLRWSFRWLPLFHLVLALVGAKGLADIWHRSDVAFAGTTPKRSGRFVLERLRHNSGTWAMVLIVLAWISAEVFRLGSALSDRFATKLLALALLWVAIDVVGPHYVRIRAAVPASIVLVGSCLTYFELPTEINFPRYSLGDDLKSVAPFRAEVRYLGLYRFKDVWVGHGGRSTGMRPFNFPMYSGVQFVNGYSGMEPAGLKQVLGFQLKGDVTEAGALKVLREMTGRHENLDLMAVDGLVIASGFDLPRSELIERGWRFGGRFEDGLVYYREGQLSPRVRAIDRAFNVNDDVGMNWLVVAPAGSVSPAVAMESRFGGAELRLIRDTRNFAEVEVEVGTEQDALILFSRPWFPGYMASLNGEPLEVGRINKIMPAVRVPAGSEGRLTLRYLPRSLSVGAVVSLSSLLLLVTSPWWARFSSSGRSQTKDRLPTPDR